MGSRDIEAKVIVLTGGGSSGHVTPNIALIPGLTNRLSMPFAKKVCYTFPESGKHIPKSKGVLTGIPIRKSILHGDKELGRKICGFTDTKPVLMVIGGSQGSENINKVVRESMKILIKDYQVCHICGKGNIKFDFAGLKGYKQFEYINEELPHIFAVSDIIVSRAGATTLFEILALGKPNLLIPLSLNASRGDQILNAQSFEKQGFSLVLREESLSAETLINKIEEVYKNRDRYKNVMNAGNASSVVDTLLTILEKVYLGEVYRDKTN